MVFGFINNVYALDLDNLKAYFLSGDYKAAITEGEKVLAGARHSPEEDELYYILGLSYLQDGNYLRASDIFEIIIKEFRNSRFAEESKLSLGDIYFLRGDLDKAQDCYKKIIQDKRDSRLKASVLYRLAQVGFKKGDIEEGKVYLEKLKEEFPMNLELQQNKEFCALTKPAADIYYTVQVGSFSDAGNAGNLSSKLNSAGYDAYIEETGAGMYRVRVGKFKSRQEAGGLEARLSGEGYPTKICP